MLAGAHKKFYRIQHPEIYLLGLKVQYKHKIKLPRDLVQVNMYFCTSASLTIGPERVIWDTVQDKTHKLNC